MLVKNIHTVQTVYVHGPPPVPIPQNLNTQSHIQNSIILQRPVSAPKISINYSNHPINSNVFVQAPIRPMNQSITTSIMNQPKI